MSFRSSEGYHNAVYIACVQSEVSSMEMEECSIVSRRCELTTDLENESPSHKLARFSIQHDRKFLRVHTP
jgi:hypothetical protein